MILYNTTRMSHLNGINIYIHDCTLASKACSCLPVLHLLFFPPQARGISISKHYRLTSICSLQRHHRLRYNCTEHGTVPTPYSWLLWTHKTATNKKSTLNVKRLLVWGGAKAIPLQAWSGPEGSRKLRFPDFMTTAQDGGKVVSLTHRPLLPSGNTLGTHFC